MINQGARMISIIQQKKEKHIYYVELPIPQDVNDQ